MEATLTPRQERILRYIQEAVSERGYPPTVREIGDAVGLTSSSSVHSQLANLEELGLIKRDPTKPRAIGLASPAVAPKGDGGSAPRRVPPGVVEVPLVGSIAAGAPTLAADTLDEVISVPTELAGPGELLALRIEGESMTGAGIFDGDLVVIHRQDDADDGDIVAAIIPGPGEEEATVKRLSRRNGHTILSPENPAFEPFEMTDGRILGKVTAVLRKL